VEVLEGTPTVRDVNIKLFRGRFGFANFNDERLDELAELLGATPSRVKRYFHWEERPRRGRLSPKARQDGQAGGDATQSR
jgi:hypothetical protein